MEHVQPLEETSFLLPMPRDRHSENEPSAKKPPIEGPAKIIKLPPASPHKKHPPNKKQRPPKNDCRTQLQLVDKDVTTGRSYIKALDKRFRILKRNLQKALHDCQGRRLEEASHNIGNGKIELVNEVQSFEDQGSEFKGSGLVLHVPQKAVCEFQESHWGSVLDSIQEILPKIVETDAPRNKYEELDLQPACSFRSYSRGRRYGRRYEDFDSDLESDYDDYRRYRGYGRGRYDSYNDPYYDQYYGNYHDDSERNYENRRTPYGRRYGYDSYYGRKIYGRRRDNWLTSNEPRDTRNKGHGKHTRVRIEQHKDDPYDGYSSEDFYYSSDEDLYKSSGFDSFSGRSYSGPSDSYAWSDEGRGDRKRGTNEYFKRKEDRKKVDLYEGRNSRHHEQKYTDTPKSGVSARPRGKYTVSCRRYHDDRSSRHLHDGRRRFRDYYSNESSFDTDWDENARYGIRKHYRRDRYARRYGYGNNDRHGRRRRHGSFYDRRYRNRKYDRRQGSRYGRGRHSRYYRSDSDYDSEISNYAYYDGNHRRSYGSRFVVDSDSSSSDGRYRRDWSRRRNGDRRYHIPRYYVSTGCRQKCKPKAIEPSSPSKNKEQSSQPRANDLPTKGEALTC